MATGIPMILSAILTFLNVVCSLAGLICFIFVVVEMFKRNEPTMGIVCLVTTFLCGIGILVGFVYGWVKAGAWNLKKVMICWTCAIVLGFVLAGVSLAMAFLMAPAPQPVPFDLGPGGMDVDIDFGDTNFGDTDPFPQPETEK